MLMILIGESLTQPMIRFGGKFSHTQEVEVFMINYPSANLKNIIARKNKVGYTANKKSLAGKNSISSD